MKGVILAAGRGERLALMGWDKPKCLLKFGGQTLLDNIVSSLLENSIDRLTVVVGYKKELVIDRLKQHQVTFDIVINKDYADTNTIHSLYLAREYLNEDFIYFNADVLFDSQLITRLVCRDGNVFAIEDKTCGEEEVKVIVDKDRRIIRIGKKLEPQECLGEFIGVGKFTESSCEAMVRSLCRFNEELGERDLFFEAAVDIILDEHVFYAMPLDDLRAIEIDNPDDYSSAKKLWEKNFSQAE
ncbi:MAG: phosphocholine cytidylyltransferase family protein [Planctomycetota bacterium]|jgi:choline kinase